MTEEDRLKILKYLADSNVEPHENQNSNELSVTEAGRFIVTPATQRKRPPTARRDSSNDSEPYEVIEVKAELHTDETYVDTIISCGHLILFILNYIDIDIG